MITLCACGQKEDGTEIYTKIYEKYKDIQSYQCKMTMNVTSNKTVRNYTLQQYYKTPDKYKVEFMEPEEIKGMTMVYKDQGITTIHPAIQGKFTLSDFTLMNEPSYMFLPDFFKTYYKSEETSVTVAKTEDSRNTILKTEIPGNNSYRFNQGLWIDNETLLPKKMEVYDAENKPVLSITYHEIEFNREIKDEIFDIE